MGFIFGGVPVNVIVPSTEPGATMGAVNLPALVVAAEETRNAIARMKKLLLCIWVSLLN
jgi:hypothetical protein